MPVWDVQGVVEGLSQGSRGTGVEAMTVGEDVSKTPSKASKKLPFVNYPKTLVYLIPLHPVTGDLCIPDC